MIKKPNTLSLVSTCVIGLALAAPASATEGYFQNGAGARHKALTGAGVADGQDATAAILNPAGIVGVGDNLTVAASLFTPDRGYTGTGQGFTPSGKIEGNQTESFIIPNISYVRQLDENRAVGVSIYGNGGLNADYAAVTNPACAQPGLPDTVGVFCGGALGVNLNQAFISGTYAQDFGAFTLGVSPIVALQSFEAKGLGAFAGVSGNPAALTNNGTDWAYGFGVKFGAVYDASDRVRVAGAYQPTINMSEFDDYAGLFAEGGGFDIPSDIQIGIAFDASDNITLLADWRQINYSEVASVANSPTAQFPLGSDNGAGFGWDDISAIKLGVEWDINDSLTLRGGYSWNDNPIDSGDVTLNILAPGVVTQHFTAGFAKSLGTKNAIEGAIMFAPKDSVNGIEVTPFGANPNQNIDLYMSQIELTLGWSRRLGS